VDQNSKLFHNFMINQDNRNYISNLRLNIGSTIENHQDIEKDLKDDFNRILSKLVEDNWVAIQHVIHLIPTPISPKKIHVLHPISFEEVSQTILEIAPNKSPGLDLFIIEFFQSCWSMVDREV